MNEERIRVRLPRLLKKEIESGGALKEAGRLRPLRLELELNMAPLSTAKMTLAENDLPVAMHDLIELYNQHGSAGVYRVTNIQTTYRREREIELKHAIDILHDTVYPGDPAGDEEFDGTVAAFLAKMFTVQSQKMNNVPFWQLGTCEDTGHWNRKIAYDNLYDLITEVSREHEDYLFTFDFSTFPWTVNFVEKNNEVLSEFRLRRNMSSCEVSLDDADLCTRLYLSVTTEEPDNGQSGTSTGKKTTETFATYDDAYSQAIWGVVEKSAGIKASDYPDTAAWVEDYFRRHATPTVQITIDGVELSELTGESIDEMHLGRICRVALPEYGTTFLERIVSVSYPDVLRTPTRVTVSLANKRESAEDSIAGITKQTESAAAAGRGMAGQIADAEEEIRQYRTWQTKTDKKIGDYAEIMGVTIDPTTGDVVYETDEQGNIKLDEDGNPIPVFDPTSQYSLYAKHEVTAQRIVNYVGLTGIRFDAQGNPIYKQAKDAQGNPIYDAQGNPVYETDSQGNPIPDLDAADGHSMYSQISQSIDSIDSVVSGHTDDISRIEQKADRIISEVTAARGGETTLSSRITQLATEITSKVSQTDLNTTLNGYVTTTAFGTTIGAVKDEDGNITAASITAAINDEGSAAYINADHVYVTGTTLLSGQVTVNDGMFYVLTSLGVGNAAGGGDIVSINNGKVSASTYDVKISGKVNFVVDNKTHYELTAAKVKNLVTGFGTTARVGQTISIPYSTISSPEINASSPKIDLTVPDAIATITVDDNPPEGKIGFKYTTLSNSQPVAVNFKIADTAYYKSHVGIKTTGSWQWDDEEEKYYRTIAPNDGQSETIDLPTFTTSVGTFNDQHKATILFKGPNNHTVASAIADASGLYSEAQNSVNVSGPTWSAVDSSNPYTRTATFRPSIGTGSTADLVLSGAWSYAGNAISASAVYSVSDTTDPDPTNHIKLFSTTASLAKDYNQNNANNVLVYLTDGGQNRWAQTTINIAPGTISIPDPTSTYNDGKYTISATGAFTVDNNSYSMTAGSYTLTATDAINDGKDSVTLGEFTWSEYTQQNPSLPPNRTVSINVLGRATAINPKRLNLYLTNSGNWSPEHKQAVYLRAGNASGTQFAAVTLDATSEYYLGKSSVLFTDSGWSHGTRTIGISGRTDASGTANDESCTMNISIPEFQFFSAYDSGTGLLTLSASPVAKDGTDTVATGTGSSDYTLSSTALTLKSNAFVYDANSTYSGYLPIVYNSGGVFKVGNTSTISANVTQYNQRVVLGQPSATIVWNSNTHKYDYHTDAAVSFGSTNVLTRTNSGHVLDPTEAIEYGKTLAPASSAVDSVKKDGTAEFSTNYKTVYIPVSAYDASNNVLWSSTIGTRSTYVSADISDTYTAGQNSVEISTATLSNVVYNSSARSATAVLTVSLNNGKSKTFSDRVDVSTPYQAGLDGGSAVNTQRFTIRLTDNSGFNVNKYKNVDTSAIYQKGVEDATPPSEYPKDMYVYASNSGYVNIRASAYSSAPSRGGLYPNTKVTVTGVTGTTNDWYTVTYDGVSGYINSSFLHKDADSPTKYYDYGRNKTGLPLTGWYTKPYICGVYISGYTGSQSVAVYDENNTMQWFRVCGSESEAFARNDDNYTIKASQAFSTALAGRTLVVCYSDGTTQNLVIQVQGE